MQENFFPPQARKQCRNGGPDTDSNWDNKQNGKDEKIKKGRGGEESRMKRQMSTKERAKIMVF
jgi:hypothetical protein